MFKIEHRNDDTYRITYTNADGVYKTKVHISLSIELINILIKSTIPEIPKEYLIDKTIKEINRAANQRTYMNLSNIVYSYLALICDTIALQLSGSFSGVINDVAREAITGFPMMGIAAQLAAHEEDE